MLGSWQSFLLTVLAALGFFVLATDLAALGLVGLIAATLVVVLLRVLIQVFDDLPSLLERFGVLLGALVLPVLALVGVDAIWAWFTEWRPSALLSAGAGGVLIGLGAWLFHRPWWRRTQSTHVVSWIIATVVVLAVLPPPGVWFWHWVSGGTDDLPQKTEAVSNLDVIVLRGRRGVPLPGHPDRQGWHVRTWSATVDEGGHIAWAIGGSPPAISTDHSDHVLLLFPDDKADVKRWLRIADAAASRSTPTYAFISSAKPTLREAWHTALNGHSADARHGDALGPADVTAGEDTTDLALRTAVLDARNRQDLAIAAQHRPALRFDKDEPDPKPLNVDDVLASGKLSLCRSGQGLRTFCSTVHGSADLENDQTNLDFDLHELEDKIPEMRSTMYVNVTHSGNDWPNTTYLDYWWYLPDNPTGAAGGALCGAGFVIAGATCLDHQSDWEGVTVVLDDDDASGRPLAVSYAQHNGVVRYTWRAAEALWHRQQVEPFSNGVDTSKRPLVFVAHGTHASYPTPCFKKKCLRILAPRLPSKDSFTENRHNGSEPWDYNVDCREICLEALPTRNGGLDPARWNAFDGYWGGSTCALLAFCTKDHPPRSPGSQGRYKNPWCRKLTIDYVGANYVLLPGVCAAARDPSAAELQQGEPMVALGDSFSSGQGGGDYESGTNSDDNSCFRSRGAWPYLLARAMHLVARPSWACSSAVADDVLSGRPRHAKGWEPERGASQISRLRDNRGLITITIGGNDLGFSKILRKCIARNCKAFYHKPSGDLLDATIAELKPDLEGVYHAIRRAAPKAWVVVVGYPRLFPRSDKEHPLGNCSAGDAITKDEANYLNGETTRFNLAIADAARQTGASFVDVSDAFDGHELRCTGPSYVNRLSLHPERFPASYHPNGDGYAKLSEVVGHALRLDGRHLRQ